MNDTTPRTVGWTGSPDTRGTIDLIWSCLATIFLCTWSAVHLDVPRETLSTHRAFWRRFGYVGLTLLIPEMIVADAVKSLVLARHVQALTPNWSLKKAFFMSMRGFRVIDPSSPSPEPVVLEPEKFIEACKAGYLPWPDTTDSEIDDRSKADGIVKVFTAIQFLWFVSQIIGRIAFRLPLATIELSTSAMVLCAIIMYFCWWCKPFDVQTPVVVEALQPLTSLEDHCTGIPSIESSVLRYSSTALTLASMIFGSIHVAGWGFYFPSVAEKWLWRVCSIGCTVLPLLLLMAWFLLDISPVSKRAEDKVENVAYIIFLSLYVPMRIYLFIEMFVSLRSAPAAIYETPKWSQYFPGFG